MANNSSSGHATWHQLILEYDWIKDQIKALPDDCDRNDLDKLIDRKCDIEEDLLGRPAPHLWGVWLKLYILLIEEPWLDVAEEEIRWGILGDIARLADQLAH